MVHGKVHWITGNTQQERYEKAIQLFLGSSAHVPEKKKGPLFRPYAEKWFQVFRKGKIRHTTEAEYCSILQKHIYPALGQKELTSITAADIQLLMDSKADMARKTVHEIRMVAGMVLDSAYHDGIIPRNPAKDPRLRNPAMGKHPRKALDEEELFHIIQQLPCLSQPRDQRFLALLIYTGMRREEVLALRWQDIDWEKQRIHVHSAITFRGNKPVEGPTKTENGNRFIPITDALVPWLLPSKTEGFVICAQVTSSYVKRMWERIKREIDVHDATPHCFRHTFTTMAYHNGIDEKTLQAIGGWGDLNTMRNIYTHVQEKHQEKARAALDAFFGSKCGEKSEHSNAPETQEI